MSSWGNKTSTASGQKAGSFIETLATGDVEAGADGGKSLLISSSPGGSLISFFLLMMMKDRSFVIGFTPANIHV